jgi:phage host-nuclease inhibitor protein Gam
MKKDPAEAGECKGNRIQPILPHLLKEGNTMSELLKAETEGFVIDTDAKAEWALQKIREARTDRDRWVKWYKEKIDEITAQTDFDTMNLERMLAEYFATVPHKVTKTQESYKLPGGKLVMKTQNPEFKRDDKAIIDWVKANGMPQFVKVKEELAWQELKDATAVFEGHIVTEDGEIIPGVEVVNRDAKFIVEV